MGARVRLAWIACLFASLACCLPASAAAQVCFGQPGQFATAAHTWALGSDARSIEAAASPGGTWWIRGAYDTLPVAGHGPWTEFRVGGAFEHASLGGTACLGLHATVLDPDDRKNPYRLRGVGLDTAIGMVQGLGTATALVPFLRVTTRVEDAAQAGRDSDLFVRYQAELGAGLVVWFFHAGLSWSTESRSFGGPFDLPWGWRGWLGGGF